MKESGENQISSMPGNSNGFTMIEIISVLVIIGILSAVAVSKMTSANVYDVELEANILKNHLRYAQCRAMSHNVPWGISITASAYTLQKNGITATVNLPNMTSPTHTLANGVSITSGNQVIAFDDFGDPGNSNIIITLSGQGNDSRTVTITQKTGYIY